MQLAAVAGKLGFKCPWAWHRERFLAKCNEGLVLFVLLAGLNKNSAQDQYSRGVSKATAVWFVACTCSRVF